MTVLGLPVLTLHEAQQQLMAHRSLDGRFAAIEGWFNTFPIPCPQPPHEPVLAPACPNTAFTNGSLTREDVTALAPAALQPAIVPETIGAESLFGGENVHVVVIAHTGDARFGQCSRQERTECVRALVIDVVAWANGQVTAMPPGPDGSPGVLVNSFSANGTEMWQIDPRFAGLANGPARISRYIAGDPAPDGAVDGVVRLEAGTGIERQLIKEAPLKLADDYEPGRIVVEPGQGADSFDLTLNGQTVAVSQMSSADAPFSVEPGDYVLRGFDGVIAPSVGDIPGCQIPVSLGPFGDLYFRSGSRPSRRCTLMAVAPPS